MSKRKILIWAWLLAALSCCCYAANSCDMASHPCQNGGTCESASNPGLGPGSGLGSGIDYTCICPPNITGMDCEICMNTCPTGQEVSTNCSCVPIHVCSTSKPCLNGGTCINGTTLVENMCVCPEGVTGASCEGVVGTNGSGMGMLMPDDPDLSTSLVEATATATPVVISSTVTQDTAPTSTPEPTTSQPTTNPPDFAGQVWPWAAGGSALGLLALILICWWIAMCTWYTRKQRKKRAAEEAYTSETKPLWLNEDMLGPPPGFPSAHPHIQRRPFSRRTSFTSQTIRHLESLSNPLVAEQLHKALTNEPKLHAEFMNILPNMVTVNEIPAGTESKNRYRDVLPNPHTRVPLFLKFGVPNSDYINANYIRSQYEYEQYKAYIVTQGPLKSTTEDFWRMVWEQKSTVIIMLTKLKDKNKEKCFKYWPDSQSEVYGEIEVIVRSQTEEKNGMSCSTFLLAHLKHNVTREIQHYWLTGWPDRGVPTDTEPFIDFILKTREGVKNREMPGPVVVHCSSGISRSGVFIGADTAMRVLEKTNQVDLMRIVSTLRMDRGGMVQTKEQYVFLHKVLYNYAQHIGRVSPISDVAIANPMYNELSEEMEEIEKAPLQTNNTTTESQL